MALLTRRTVTAGLVAMPLAAQAQSWPAGQVTLVVPFPAGGSVDAIARAVQPLLQQKLGATLIIENKPGASGANGAGAVAKARPGRRKIQPVVEAASDCGRPRRSPCYDQPRVDQAPVEPQDGRLLGAIHVAAIASAHQPLSLAPGLRQWQPRGL